MTITQKQIQRLKQLADRAVAARAKFDAQLRKCEALEGWSTACAENNVPLHTGPIDWVSGK